MNTHFRPLRKLERAIQQLKLVALCLNNQWRKFNENL